MVNKIRTWIFDTADENVVSLKEEFSDSYIDSCIDDAVEEANDIISPEISKTFTRDTIPFSLLKVGTLVHMLRGRAVWSMRETVDYTDTGGVNVRIHNQWERYLRMAPMLEEQWMRGITALKRKSNMSKGYGGISSSYYRGWRKKW